MSKKMRCPERDECIGFKIFDCNNCTHIKMSEEEKLLKLIKKAESELEGLKPLYYDDCHKTQDGSEYIVDIDVIDYIVVYYSLLKGEVIKNVDDISKVLKSHTGIIDDTVIRRIAEEVDLLFVENEFGRRFSSSKKEGENMNEWINFKLINKGDSRLYLKGEWDITDYDEDIDNGTWEYEQNNGLMESHIPSYWKVDGENLSEEFSHFIDSIDWAEFREMLLLNADKNKSFDCGDYILHINEGAKMECEIYEPEYQGEYIVEIIPRFNGEQIDIVGYMNETNDVFNPFNENTSFIEDNRIYFEMSKSYWDNDAEERNDLMTAINDESRRLYSQSLSKELGIYAKYGETTEQLFESDYSDEWLYKVVQHLNDSDEELHEFLKEEGLI